MSAPTKAPKKDRLLTPAESTATGTGTGTGPDVADARPAPKKTAKTTSPARRTTASTRQPRTQPTTRPTRAQATAAKTRPTKAPAASATAATPRSTKPKAPKAPKASPDSGISADSAKATTVPADVKPPKVQRPRKAKPVEPLTQESAEDASEDAALAEQIRLAEEALATEEAKSRGFGTASQWLIGVVAAVLLFQVVHAAEHVAQATYWLFNPALAPWMSAWAMGATNFLGTVSGGGTAVGMELLHLIGNGVFLAGLLLATRLPQRFGNAEMRKWLRLATIVQVAHFAEHILLTTSMVFLGQAAGVSTLFGLLSASTPAASGYRVFFHLIINLIATTLALKAVLALRGVTASTNTRIGRIGYAVLAAPLAGLIFLLPLFGSHVGHSNVTDPAAVMATVNGQEITNVELEAAVAVAKAIPDSPALGEVSSGTEGLSGEQLRVTTLNRLVQNALTDQGAADMGVTIEDWEVQARLAELIENDFFGRAAFDQFLADNSVTEDYATDQVRDLLLQEKVHATLTDGVTFSPEEVDAKFTAIYDGFPRGRQLLTGSESEAQALLARAEAGESFPGLISTESQDPRAATVGGDTGPIQEGAAVPEIVAAVNSIQDGEFVVFQSQFGWHVLERLAPATLVEVENEIRTSLLLERQATEGQEWLQGLRAAAAVTLAPGHGVWDTEFGAVVMPTD